MENNNFYGRKVFSPQKGNKGVLNCLPPPLFIHIFKMITLYKDLTDKIFKYIPIRYVLLIKI